MARCYFCQTVAHPPPRNPSAFICPTCSASNRYDEDGEIMSDEPAMHDESLNIASFAKRASPSKSSQLPNLSRRNVFCHTCQTNQTLLINMLSNYLPSPKDPSYATLVAQYPAYKESLYTRYPPVCKNCRPAVEEQIRDSDYKARTSALGGWLKASKRTNRLDRNLRKTIASSRTVWMWRFRGLLWASTLIFSLVGYVAEARNLYRMPYPYILPPIALVSILWACWDPTWSHIQTARLRGVDLRVPGRETWNNHQMKTWVLRLLVASTIAFRGGYLIPPPVFYACLLFELIILALSIRALRIMHPPSIRFQSVPPSARPSLAPHTHEPDFTSDPEPLLSSLSLSSSMHPPTNHNRQPVFGQTTFPTPTVQPPTHAVTDSEDDPFAMDWTPSNPSPSTSKPTHVPDFSHWMRPQKFFAPEQPTGLEELLAGTSLKEEDDERERRASSKSSGPRPRFSWFAMWAVATSILVAITAWVVCRFGWRSEDRWHFYGAERTPVPPAPSESSLLEAIIQGLPPSDFM